MNAVDKPAWFVSQRERALWLLSGAVVVAIYSTLGLATTLASELTDRDMLDNFAAVTFFVLFAVVLLVGLRDRAPTVAGAALMAGVVATYALVFFRMVSPLERTHLFEYSLLAILIHEALRERSSWGSGPKRPAVVAIVAATFAGVVDEVIQLAIASRVFDPVDVAFNVFAATLGVGVSSAVALAAGRTAQPR